MSKLQTCTLNPALEFGVHFAPLPRSGIVPEAKITTVIRQPHWPFGEFQARGQLRQLRVGRHNSFEFGFVPNIEVSRGGEAGRDEAGKDGDQGCFHRELARQLTGSFMDATVLAGTLQRVTDKL